MASSGIALCVAVTELDADDERLDELTGHLVRDIRELGADSVERAVADAGPEGSKGDGFTIGALTLAAVPAVVPSLVSFLQAWMLDDEKQRSIRIKTPSGFEVEFTPDKRISESEVLELARSLIASEVSPATTLGRRASDEQDEVAMGRQIRILFLAANPMDTTSLRLDEEIRTIDRVLRQSEFRERFDLKQQWAVRVSDLQEHFLRFTPDIVHFSGHGSSRGEIVLEGMDGSSQSVAPRTLSSLFATLKDNIKCVVLSACYSEEQAQAIAEHIACVVGMTSAIGDKAAIHFAAAFYRALGYGRDVKTAFDLGTSQIALEGLAEQDTPKLYAFRQEPAKMFFVHSD
jgi:hypothetical protein